MASITIRDLNETASVRLTERAAHNGRSPEEEARVILDGELTGVPAMNENLYDAIRRDVEELGSFDLDILPATRARPVPFFEDPALLTDEDE